MKNTVFIMLLCAIAVLGGTKALAQDYSKMTGSYHQRKGATFSIQHHATDYSGDPANYITFDPGNNFYRMEFNPEMSTKLGGAWVFKSGGSEYLVELEPGVYAMMLGMPQLGLKGKDMVLNVYAKDASKISKWTDEEINKHILQIVK